MQSVRFRVQEIVQFRLAQMPANIDRRSLLYLPISSNFGAWDFIVHIPGEQ